eukprot:5031555-Prymnesium_polylepis.1
MIEQPIGAFEKYYDAQMQTLQPWQHGHGNSKTWRLFCSDNIPTVSPTRIVGGQKRYATSGSARQRSRTQAGVAHAIASQVNPRQLQPRRTAPPIYEIE